MAVGAFLDALIDNRGATGFMGDTKLISPALLQRHLHKAGFPATRGELLAHVREESDRVIAALRELPDRRYSRPAEVSRAFAESVSGYLGDMSYPTRRDDLAGHAERQGAPWPVVEALRRIPDRRYDRPEAVAEAVAEEEK
ncbi:hypothetical protein Airi01_047020 [Actinoallomurus iriomotensis]|uniref:DUF2795 domain-containing protein n=1 Tax=Actinoallomurus iriomotensis TaxID=478107 RepID=A0A9W6RM96_9ACTN|nr:hypothetical protein Airi01_047020 [Actinoallomurus iriomotensis]